jgi:hypothetical protein
MPLQLRKWPNIPEFYPEEKSRHRQNYDDPRDNKNNKGVKDHLKNLNFVNDDEDEYDDYAGKRSKATSVYSVNNPGELSEKSNNHAIGVIDPKKHPD